MKNIQLILVFIFGLVASIQVNAQDVREKGDKVESLKIAFITNKLALTPKEAQVFWPVYNECTEKLEALRKERNMQIKNTKEKMDSLSNKEIEAFVDSEMTFKQKELDIQKEYHNQFKKVLPIKKVAKLYMAEEAFKRQLLKKMQEQNKH